MRDDIKINDRALALQDQIIEKLEKVLIQMGIGCLQSRADL